MELAIRYLTKRRRFEQEVRVHLSKAGVGPRPAERAIVRLRELGLVDDEETCRAWIRDRGRFSPRGRGLLRIELKQRGVSEEMVEAALEEEVPVEREPELALAVLEKGAAKWAGASSAVMRRRMWSLLGRRGFDPDVTREAIARFVESGDAAPEDSDP